MDNENTNQVEMEESAAIEAAFDEDWDEAVGEDSESDLDDGADEGEQPEAAEEPATEPEEAEEPEPEEQPEAENQRFKLNYNGEELEVDRDEVIALAQKGKDYDRVKEERDKFKADSATMDRYKTQEEFLKELAKESDITVEQLMENTRVRLLMSKDEDLSEDDARKKVRESANKAAEKKEEPKAEATPEERRQRMFADFLAAYPDVKADSIPKKVWDKAGRTFDLVGAYRDHQIAELTKEVETLRQNNKNREKSTGSRRSVGSAKVKDDFDLAWDSDF